VERSYLAPFMPRLKWLAGTLSMVLATVLLAGTSEPEVVQLVRIDWRGKEFTDLSGLGIVGKYLLMANDESKHSVHVLEEITGGYKYLDPIRLANGDDELDLEGIACQNNTVYVIGSHSRSHDNKREESREKVFRFELGPDGAAKGGIEETTLRQVLKTHPTLEPAIHKKPKLGGVDIEGIAVHESWLYAGFRGPLDRSNALVLKFKFEDPAGTAQLLTVDLGGLGIRDLTRSADGFLILAGPMHDGSGPYQLHYWNGASGGKGQRLCTIPVKKQAKAEGLTVLSNDKSRLEFLIVYDGLEGGDLTRFRIQK
jgi:hypothetical protein